MALETLKGIGAKLRDKLHQQGFYTPQDILFHLPSRYQDRTQLTAISRLQDKQYAVVQGEIELTEVVFRGKRMMLCRIHDQTAPLILRFFHFSQSQRQQLKPGKHLRCFGQVHRVGWNMEMVHPEYRFIDPEHPPALPDTLTPVYPSVQGFSQKAWQGLVQQSFEYVAMKKTLQELLPAEVINEMPSLMDALRYVHYPPKGVDLHSLSLGKHPAQQRLAMEELLAHHLSLRELRVSVLRDAAFSLKVDKTLVTRFIQHLPFSLTQAQQRVANEIQADLQKQYPMMRLVQGDVGSGKTVVAALAILQAIGSNYQAALMAPTEILAEQHFKNFQTWFEPLGVHVVLLTSQVKSKQRQAILSAIESNEAQLIVGTHALFQKQVTFKRLALVVIDEQHRFGVHQRMLLREKGFSEGCFPHQLIMTATPIPRTLAMCAYADLDQSIIDELPPGRQAVKTAVLPDTRRQAVMARIREVCQAGRQVYWVCPLIEASEVLQCEAAEKTFEHLKNELPELSIALIHGRLKTQEKDAVMAAFKQGEYQVLVATTVIEVGVDAPNASLMVIENAERLGLSQLHQLRGRVGRGAHESYCLLLYRAPLSKLAKSRLQTMRETSDGFAIAEKDLELRGPGEVLGTRQTGDIPLRVADLVRDKHLLTQVASIAERLLAKNPEVIPLLIKRWLGESSRYQRV